jgi:hypothetical protein
MIQLRRSFKRSCESHAPGVQILTQSTTTCQLVSQYAQRHKPLPGSSHDVEFHLRREANDRLIISSIRIGLDRVEPLEQSAHVKTILDLVRTGGISRGSSTSLVNLTLPSSGQSSSTFLTCSHRSTVCLMSVMTPYLTCSATYAPASTCCRSFPTASMRRVWPLRKHVSHYSSNAADVDMSSN